MIFNMYELRILIINNENDDLIFIDIQFINYIVITPSAYLQHL